LTGRKLIPLLVRPPSPFLSYLHSIIMLKEPG
jgi:hypothetical protein